MQSVNMGMPSMGGGYSSPPANNVSQNQPQQMPQAQNQSQQQTAQQAAPQQAQQPQNQPQQQLPESRGDQPQSNQQSNLQQQQQNQRTQGLPQQGRANQVALNRLAQAANKQLEKMNKLNKQYDSIPTFERAPVLDQKAPKFPETAFERLNHLMNSNQMLRNEANKNFSRKLTDMKDKFFESYGYKTEQAPDGKPKLVLDQQGRPQLTHGKENFQQKIARQEYEENSRQTYSEYHSTIKENFLSGEKQKIQQFLQAHRNELSNPAIQQELQNMLSETEKKALKLKRELNDQILQLDLPTEEMREVARNESKKLQEMEDEHKKMEDSTEEAHELIMYQEEMNAFALEEKQKIHSPENSEAFLSLNGNNMLKGPSAPTLAELLPPYLVNSLYNLGIYSID